MKNDMLIESPPKKKNRSASNKRPAAKKQKTSGKKPSPENNYGKRVKNEKSRLSLPHVEAWKIILAVIIIGGLGILYLNHVFATKRLFSKVQKKEQQYKQAKRINNKYRIKYDRMTGPVVISKKAKKLGLINGGPAKMIIKIKPR